MKFPKELILMILFALGSACKEKAKEEKNLAKENTLKELQFEKRAIADSVSFLWAHDPADVSEDGIADLVFVENNQAGGKFGFFMGQKEDGSWSKQLITDDASKAVEFAMGDIETADMDNDGDLDIVAARHIGEWEAASDPSQLYWFENPSWEAHFIGEIPNFIKDLSLEDFNGDGQMEIAALTFEESTISVFQKNEDGWTRVLYHQGYKNLHEGMDVGDVNGDGYSDIVADGHVFYSPGQQLDAPWDTDNVDEKWNSQTGDWSRNGTKMFLRDLDGDKKSEVFISHSERPGYPLSYYRQVEGQWQENVIADSIPACHTLQVFDFDQDGFFDVLAGPNKTRAEDLGFTDYPVTIFRGSEGYNTWTPVVIARDGIYNGQAIDYDKDGDLDIFRYQTHDAVSYELLENKIID
ncbi:MAG: VCBS repeat-containing protein [Bacteroidota bacterium]